MGTTNGGGPNRQAPETARRSGGGGPRERLVQQLLVAPALGERGEQLGAEPCQVHLPYHRAQRALHKALDLRIFQRMEVPDQLSYYFHLLLDVSPSMLTNKNLQKALAIGYAFTRALDRLRVPVDVNLYSSAITRLYDHRRDALDPYFGGSFGYLSSGTHEIEAIAYAKQMTERVLEERKIIVVITDGQPNGEALTRAGGPDLRTYYCEVLIPWLRSAGIDLLAVGIGTRPSYHAASTTISSGWESIGVLTRLLDEIIARGRTSHAALWR